MQKKSSQTEFFFNTHAIMNTTDEVVEFNI